MDSYQRVLCLGQQGEVPSIGQALYLTLCHFNMKGRPNRKIRTPFFHGIRDIAGALFTHFHDR